MGPTHFLWTWHGHLVNCLQWQVCSILTLWYFHYRQTSSLTMLGDHRPERFVEPELEAFSTIDFDKYMQKFGRKSLLPHLTQVSRLVKLCNWDLCSSGILPPVTRCCPQFSDPVLASSQWSSSMQQTCSDGVQYPRRMMLAQINLLVMSIVMYTDERHWYLSLLGFAWIYSLFSISNHLVPELNAGCDVRQTII